MKQNILQQLQQCPKNKKISDTSVHDLPNLFIWCVAPSSPPVNFHGHNVSSTSIYVTWGDVPKPFTNGVLLGFHVACKEINSSDSNFAEFLPDEHSWVLKGLQKFTNYSCWLRAYNNFGNGTWSEGLVISTDEAGMLRIQGKM